jgi:hypothetical protein
MIVKKWYEELLSRKEQDDDCTCNHENGAQNTFLDIPFRKNKCPVENHKDDAQTFYGDHVGYDLEGISNIY